MAIHLGMINYWSEKDFQYVAKKGLHYVEFCVNCNFNADEFCSQVDDIKGYSEKYNVKIGSMGRWGDAIQDENGNLIESTLDSHMKLIEAAGKLGCPVYNCGVNACKKKSYVENCAFAIDVLRKLVECGKQNNVKIALYNCNWNCFTYEPKAWNVIIPAVPGLGIKYDATHAISRGCDYMQEMIDWAPYFYHVHLKGAHYVNGQYYDAPPMGLDDINWGSFFNVLYTNNYNGMVSLEPHSSYWQGKLGEWGIDFSIKYAKQFIMPEDYFDVTSNQ